MVVHGETVGVLSLMLSSGARSFDDDDVLLAEELARRAAVAVENARLYRNAIAREEERRRHAEHNLELLIDSIQDYAVFMLDGEGHVQSWNPGAQRIKGYGAHEIIGRHFSIFYPPEDPDRWKRLLAIAEREGRVEDEGWRIRKDGSRFWANVLLSAVRDERGELVGFSKVTRDLSERKRAEEEKTARLAAEAPNQAKDEFLALLGHELRNPLAPVVTALQLLKLRGDVRSSREQQIIERQVKHMVRLVDDLLDVSRITRGKIELKRHTHDLRDVVARAVEVASPLLEQKRHHFEVEVPPHPLHVDGRSVAVEVRDDGIGIAPELMSRIFEPFVQGAQSADRSLGGLGIGLSLVRALVDLHGGEVSAFSDGPGQGATFRVRLPLVAATPRHVESSEPHLVALPGSAGGRRVLVVDDNEDALELLAEILRGVGHEVRTAADGAEALQVARDFRPEVAVLDIGLPVMDGYELAIRLRQDFGDEAPRLIALSGYGLKADRARSAEAGFEQHLVKPVDARDLLQAIGAPAARFDGARAGR